MAVGVQKYKVNNMAKDIDKKAKEIVELLKEKGYEGKSSSSVLETDEINVVLNHYLNQSKVDDIAEYLSAKKPEEKTQDTVQQEQTKAPAPVAETAKALSTDEAAQNKEAIPASEQKAVKTGPEADSEPNQAEKKQETAAPANSSNSSVFMSSEVARPAVQPVQQEAPVQPAERSSQEPNKPNSDFAKPSSQPKYQGQDAARGSVQQQSRPSQHQNQADGSRKPFEKRSFDGQKRPYAPGQNHQSGQFGQRNSYSQGGQMTEKQIERQISKIQREGAQLLKQEGIKPEKLEQFPRFDKNERYDKYTNVKFTKDGFVSETPQSPAHSQKNSKPRPQKNSQNSFGRDRDEDTQSVRQPSLKPVFDKDGRIKSRYAGERIEGSTPNVDTDGKVRIVDMRTSEVDLSK